jgi:hypothetical protein
LNRAQWLGALVLLRRRVGKLASLSFEDWCICFEGIATNLIVSVALQVFGFPTVMSWAIRGRRVHAPSLRRESVERTAWLAGAAGRLLGLSCLTISLGVARLLSRRGITTELRIGVRPENGKLRAHAWLEWRGGVVTDEAASLQSFAVLNHRGMGTHSNV